MFAVVFVGQSSLGFPLVPSLLLVAGRPADPVCHSAAGPEPQREPAGKSRRRACAGSLRPLLLPSAGQNWPIFLILSHFITGLVNHKMWGEFFWNEFAFLILICMCT